MDSTLAKSKLMENLDKTISLEMTNSLGYKIKRRGKLEYQEGWFYMYEPNKSGSAYCIAINEKTELHRIISINVIE